MTSASCSAPASTGIRGRSASPSTSSTRDHPSTAHLPAGWQFTDELYLFRDLRADAHVLLEAPGDDLDMGAKGARRPSIGFPLAWCFEEGEGRVFYTALGHFPGAYEDVRFLGHLYGGLEWLLARDP